MFAFIDFLRIWNRFL